MRSRSVGIKLYRHLGSICLGLKCYKSIDAFEVEIFSSRFFLNVMTSFKDSQKCHSEPCVFPATGVYVITQE